MLIPLHNNQKQLLDEVNGQAAKLPVAQNKIMGFQEISLHILEGARAILAKVDMIRRKSRYLCRFLVKHVSLLLFQLRKAT